MPKNTPAHNSAKKPRWSSEKRAAHGKPAERPRGGAAASDRGYSDRAGRPERSGRPERAARPQRAEDGRPVWEPRGKDAKFRPERAPEERRRSRDERPARSYDDRPRRSWDERPPREDRAAREDRPARRSYDERPARSYDDRPARRSFDDRPARDERPARDDRPARRSFDERPARRSFDDRPARRSFDDRPRRSYDDRPAPRRDRDERPAEAKPFVEDVVLERLTAQAVEAGEVSGLGFGDLGLGQNITTALEKLGAVAPFPIQAATIPDVLAGRDVLGRGRTGSGKTIAFGAPLVERLLQMQRGDQKRREFGRAPRALILAPTRELALQIDRTVQPLAQSVGLFTTQIYGGVPYARQLGALQRGVDIVIGTPGRVGVLAGQGKLDLSKTVITVLDEADHMCELGFAEPVQEILDRTAVGGQKLLFSATLDSGVAEIVEKYLVEPAVFEVAGEDQASSTIDHRVLLLDQRDKQQVLVELASGPGKKLVFARTRAFAEQLADLLDDHGIRAESIHGDLTQSRRTRALEKLTSGRVDVLVATDVAARGIHVDDIALVIQADAPDEYKAYLHRSGRTGRAGKEGTVVTLVPRNRRRRTEDLLARAEIQAEWSQVVPGDALIAELAGN
ncbi:DEAD/DEAH box helicase [Pseudolysinimonas sp.]|uniref:DEAD/DEAH box helicase n=1 Tax=Pseudolysinimonas sp. TaxID=2680009 RepID=UPI003F7E1340